MPILSAGTRPHTRPTWPSSTPSKPAARLSVQDGPKLLCPPCRERYRRPCPCVRIAPASRTAPRAAPRNSSDAAPSSPSAHASIPPPGCAANPQFSNYHRTVPLITIAIHTGMYHLIPGYSLLKLHSLEERYSIHECTLYTRIPTFRCRLSSYQFQGYQYRRTGSVHPTPCSRLRFPVPSVVEIQ